MTIINIANLKAAQDELERRKLGILRSFSEFRAGFVERLDSFVEEASQIGLRDVGPYKKKIVENGETDIRLPIRWFNVTILASDDVFEKNDADMFLSARMFIYDHELEDAKPIIDAIIEEMRDGTHHFTMHYHNDRGHRILKASSVVNKDIGRQAADEFLVLLYQFRVAWNERPTLMQALNKRTGNDTIGFRR